MSIYLRRPGVFLRGAALCLTLVVGMIGSTAQAQVTAFMQAVAEASSRDAGIAAFYKANGYQPIWTGNGGKDKSRRSALLKALASADDHGLPAKNYDLQFLQANMRAVKSERDLGKIEVELSRLFLQYATDVQTGILTPSRVDPGIWSCEVPYRGRAPTLARFLEIQPCRFPEIAAAVVAGIYPVDESQVRDGKAAWQGRLGRASARQEAGAGPVRRMRSSHLRNRLIAMGYMRRNAGQVYDGKMQSAVQQFQLAHGLNPDGVAGPGTLAEINVQAEDRLAAIVVAMERERWMNTPAWQAPRLGQPDRFHRADHR